MSSLLPRPVGKPGQFSTLVTLFISTTRIFRTVCRIALHRPKLPVIPFVTSTGIVNEQFVKPFALEQTVAPTLINLFPAPISVFLSPLGPMVVLARTKDLTPSPLLFFTETLCFPVSITLVAIAEAKPNGPLIVNIYLLIPSPLELLNGTAGRLPVLTPSKVTLAAGLALINPVVNP